MKNKLLKLSLVVGTLAVALFVVAAVGAFAFTISTTPVQAEEVLIDTIDEAPIQVEPVVNKQVEKPVLTIEKASYAGYSGGCQYHEKQSAQQQMVEAPSEQIDDQLLTLAE